MKQIISLLLLSISLFGFSQTATITNRLVRQLDQSSSNDFIKVNVVFTQQVDHIKLNSQFKNNNTPLSERAKVVIRESMQQADFSQKPILSFLKSYPTSVKNSRSFWIINMMEIEATKSIILQLANNPTIDYIEEFNHFEGKPVEINKIKASNAKSVGGNEPGLAAINAPALWNMGYSGKGRRYFSIDTGVWPEHPALSDNWLGNHQPLTQAWYGIDSPVPLDKSGAHGTHTAGTVVGMAPATNDTIGVAYNAYFMASDPIVVDHSLIKPLADYIAVFEFALNPDGDTTTTDDIPDAINNSWGIDEHDDTTICVGYVTQMFDAIEAAGIANVFSAGNEGSGDTTIGKPQYVSTGLVNTFTVGAVSGAIPTFPIASFSSRGPTVCPTANSSLQIKPEVVAPGVNVRSAVANNGYANYQGTSMAGPHAAGAVLLLKEAFPNVSGEEILLALYNSAIDLGVVGEDNTYGKGMIDVLAAFNLLSATHTPVSPSSYKYDLAVTEILSPTEKMTCSQTFTPKFILLNKGDSTITSAVITYQLNDETLNTFNWTGTLNTGDTTSITLSPINALTVGNYELKIKASIDTLLVECDYINNQKVFRFNIRDTYTLPFFEDFENIQLNASNWIIENDDSFTWDTATTSGLSNGNISAYINLFNYSPGSHQRDAIITEKITLPNQDSLFLKFDVAYNERIFIVADTLRIYLSTDCGLNYTEIYKKGGADLETETGIASNFVPVDSNDWRTDFVDITAYAGNDVLIKFESDNKNGNNLYLDNIWVYEGAEPSVSIVENNNLNEISIYPNPTNDNIVINLKGNDLDNASIQLFDILGKVVYSKQMLKQEQTVHLGNFKQGVYLLKFNNNKGSKVYKVIKR